MSADTNPGAGFNDQLVSKKIRSNGNLLNPIHGIYASEPKALDPNIRLQYVIAEPGNPWKYEPGIYLKTNYPPDAFETVPNATRIVTQLGAIVVRDFTHEFGSPQGEIDGFVLVPRYVGPDNGVIFRLSGKPGKPAASRQPNV